MEAWTRDALPEPRPEPQPPLDPETLRALAAAWPRLMRGETARRPWVRRAVLAVLTVTLAAAALAALAGQAILVRELGIPVPGLRLSSMGLTEAAHTLVPDGAEVLGTQESACQWGPPGEHGCAVLQVSAGPGSLEERAAAYEAQARRRGWSVAGRLMVQDSVAVHLRRPGYSGFIEVRSAAQPACAGSRADPAACADTIHVRRVP
ncbi:MAG TPA: hypothetical protein VIO14_00090 [Dehalococcoidia bacterium]